MTVPTIRIEDGNISMTMFVPGEGDKLTEAALFMVRAAE